MNKALLLFRDLLNSGFVRLAMMVGIFWLTWRLTEWSMAFGSTALSTKADLLGAAGVIGAVAAAPVALLTILTTKYMETRGKP